MFGAEERKFGVGFPERVLANTTAFCRLAPYERRVIELLRNSKDKRARKLAKKRVCCCSDLHTLGVVLRASSLGDALHKRRKSMAQRRIALWTQAL